MSMYQPDARPAETLSLSQFTSFANVAMRSLGTLEPEISGGCRYLQCFTTGRSILEAHTDSKFCRGRFASCCATQHGCYVERVFT